jgi:hypothetical protein
MSMPSTWSPDPLGHGEPEAKCRGCAQPLWQGPRGWEDYLGIYVCVKLRLEDVGSGPPNYVFHEPMPEGLRGAPLTQ